MTDENHPPQQETPQRTCERDTCSRAVPDSLGTRPRQYCSRNCRQRAYEERKLEAQIREARAAAAAAAVLRERTSRDNRSRPGATSRDDRPQTGATSRDDRLPLPMGRGAGRPAPLLPPPPGTVRRP